MALHIWRKGSSSLPPLSGPLCFESNPKLSTTAERRARYAHPLILLHGRRHRALRRGRREELEVVRHAREPEKRKSELEAAACAGGWFRRALLSMLP
jgi:hypothetical protein